MTTERLRIEPLLRQHAALLYPVLQDDRIYGFKRLVLTVPVKTSDGIGKGYEASAGGN